MSLPNCETDEALWAAYRRDDKAAVMDYLFRRTLVGISGPASFPQLVFKTYPKAGLAIRRPHLEDMQINRRRRRIALRSRR
jgi:hypothetical protein